MHDEEQCHRDAMVVMDKGLAAALCAKSHKTMTLFQDGPSSTFYAIYEVTQQLRDDIRLYHMDALGVSPKQQYESLEELDYYLADQQFRAEARLQQQRQLSNS